MNVELNARIILLLNIMFCLVTISLNMSSIHRYFSHKLHGNQHLTLLTVKVIFDAFFALVAWIYSVLMILKLEGQITSNEYAFLLGNLTFSLELSMGVLSVFIALDRLLSMRRPFEYGQIYSPIILKLALCSMFFAFLTAFTVYYITRKADISQGYMFYQFADYTAQTYVHLTMSTVFLLNILITFVVIFDFRRFMTTGVQSYMVTYVKKLAFANRIVRYQMVADLVTLIIPNLAIPVLKYGFGFDLVARVGPITPPLFSLYVAFCAMLFRFVAAKK